MKIKPPRFDSPGAINGLMQICPSNPLMPENEYIAILGFKKCLLGTTSFWSDWFAILKLKQFMMMF